MNRTQNFIFSLWLYIIVRIILAGVFIIAGISKLTALEKFAHIISTYALLPEFLIMFTAIGLAIVEILCGIGLIFDMPYALEAITMMIIIFIGILWFGILQDIDVDCGCFSSIERAEHENLSDAMKRDFIFLAMAIYLFLWRIFNKINRIKFPKKYFGIKIKQPFNG